MATEQTIPALREMTVEIEAALSWIGADDAFAEDMFCSALGTATMMVLDGDIDAIPEFVIDAAVEIFCA